MDLPGLADLSFLPSIVTRAEIPEDIASVQVVDHDAEVSPVDVGLEPDAADNIWSAALRWYRTGIHPALSVCIRVRGQVLLRRAVGYTHGGGPSDPRGTAKIPVTPDTPFNIFSASKPMAAMVIHLLDQRHLLHLDDPVSEYIPEFARHGKEWVTIRHVLTHRAGIPTIPEAALDLAYLEDVDNREAVRLLCEARPTSRAGGRLAYHAVTGGFLIGEIVRRVTGKNIRTVVDEELCGPLGWRWMNFGVSPEDVPLVASSYMTGLPLVPPLRQIAHGMLGIDFVEAVELSNDPRYLTGVLPAANLVATADELSQFYQLLLDGGELRGHRVFDPLTVWRATSEQSYGEFDFTLGVPLRYGMGFMLGGEYLSLYGFDSRHAFGHLGLTNIVSWADPQRHLAVAIMNSGKPVLYPEMHRAFGLAYAIAAACPKDDSVSPRPHVTSRPRRSRVAEAPVGATAAAEEAAPRTRKGKAAKKEREARKGAKGASVPKAARAVAASKAPRAGKPEKSAKATKPPKAARTSKPGKSAKATKTAKGSRTAKGSKAAGTPPDAMSAKAPKSARSAERAIAAKPAKPAKTSGKRDRKKSRKSRR